MYMRENRFSGARMKKRPIKKGRKEEYSLESITQHEEEEFEDFEEEEYNLESITQHEEEEFKHFRGEAKEDSFDMIDFNNPVFRKQVFSLVAFAIGKMVIARVFKFIGLKAIDVSAPL